MSIPPQDPSSALRPAAPQLPPYQADYSGQYYAGAPAKSKTLGVVAFVAGLVVLVGSPIISVVTGTSVGHLVAPGDGFAAGFAAGANSHDPATAISGLLIIVQLLFGTGLGVWAIIQGIFAIRSRRGRTWGILAIVFAGVAPILSFIVYIVVAGITQSAG